VNAPEGLAERGSALWEALHEGLTWDPAGALLVAEACRMADRLEKLDLLLRDDIGEWARVVENYDSGGKREINLEIDDALAEARQQQNTLLQLLTKLGLGKSTAAVAKQGDALDEFARRRAARVAAASAG
jgi:hypothetical protein